MNVHDSNIWIWDALSRGRACAEHLRVLGHERFAIVTFELGKDEYCGYIDRNNVGSPPCISFQNAFHLSDGLRVLMRAVV